MTKATMASFSLGLDSAIMMVTATRTLSGTRFRPSTHKAPYTSRK